MSKLPPQRLDAWRYPPKPSWRTGVTAFIVMLGFGALLVSVFVLAIN